MVITYVCAYLCNCPLQIQNVNYVSWTNKLLVSYDSFGDRATLNTGTTDAGKTVIMNV